MTEVVGTCACISCGMLRVLVALTEQVAGMSQADAYRRFTYAPNHVLWTGHSCDGHLWTFFVTDFGSVRAEVTQETCRSIEGQEEPHA